MTHRKHTPLHGKWHRRVEGQLRDTIYSHPEWFLFEDEHEKNCCINSIAKRVVGEIVADGSLVDNTENCGAILQSTVIGSGVYEVLESRDAMAPNCGIPDTNKPGFITW